MRTTRRTLVQASLAATAAAALLPISLHAQEGSPARRLIPSTREAMPIVGLGTWITFNVGGDPVLRDECASVMAAFFEAGGRMIDSSPMYGSSQPVVGYGLQKLGRPSALFSAEKIWTSSAADYGKWRPAFDSHSAMQKAAGLSNPRVLRSADDKNEIVIIFGTTDTKKAKEFATSSDLKDVMTKAGVIDVPTMYFLESI